jgi:hypothetical protein
MTIGTSRAIVGAGIILVIGGGFLYYMKRDTSAYAEIASFDECAKAGYAVHGDTPPVCTLPDGRMFTGVATTTASATSTPGTSTASTTSASKIKVTSPTSGQLVTSPLTVTGSARGYWYFEASFPMTLIDGNGKTIAQTPGKATSDWMTNDFVPFVATLDFAAPSTATGTLILRNDNPSGLPENQEEIRIPVRFR